MNLALHTTRVAFLWTCCAGNSCVLHMCGWHCDRTCIENTPCTHVCVCLLYVNVEIVCEWWGLSAAHKHTHTDTKMKHDSKHTTQRYGRHFDRAHVLSFAASCLHCLSGYCSHMFVVVLLWLLILPCYQPHPILRCLCSIKCSTKLRQHRNEIRLKRSALALNVSWSILRHHVGHHRAPAFDEININLRKLDHHPSTCA